MRSGHERGGLDDTRSEIPTFDTCKAVFAKASWPEDYYGFTMNSSGRHAGVYESG